MGDSRRVSSIQTLIGADALARHLDDPTWRIVDCRYSLADPAAGRSAYLASHVPGAVHADVDRHLSGPRVPGKTGRHPLPEKAQWIEQVRRFGISPATRVAAYDDAGGAFAARLWWMLRWIGHDRAAVLDGGWRAWTSRGLPVTAEVPTPERAEGDWTGRPPLTRLVEAEHLDAAQQLVLDARDPVRFSGESEPIDPVAGHIPGARCSPAAANLDAQGYFKPPSELRRKFAAAGVAGDRDVVCYCGSGITAAHNILAMRIAGFSEPSLFAGSWSEWITDPARGVATGDCG